MVDNWESNDNSANSVILNFVYSLINLYLCLFEGTPRRDSKTAGSPLLSSDSITFRKWEYQRRRNFGQWTSIQLAPTFRG